MKIRREEGLTLIEILIALAIFGVVIAGALGSVGATSSGGLMELLPTGQLTGRVAKDMTVAGTYLQGLQEFVAAHVDTIIVNGVPRLYCTQGSGSCVTPTALTQWCPGNSYAGSMTTTAQPAGLSGAQTPGVEPYQLDWNTLYVLVEQWHWDDSSGMKKYTSTAPADGESLVRVCSVLAWDLKDQVRVISLDRFVPMPTP